MNALIFAAGLGTRLRPLTDTMPKAMVPIGGKPLVQWLIEKLKCSGVTSVVINVHHFAQQIVDFIAENQAFGLDIRFSDETDLLLETGGGLKKAAKLFPNEQPILVHNVDILSDMDLGAFYRSVLQTEGQPTTLLVSQRQTQRYLLADGQGRLVGWTNIATGQVKSPYPDLDVSVCQKVAFSGIQVFNQQLLPLMDAWEGKFSIIDFYLSVCDKVDIRLQQQPDLHLLDVGKLDSIEKAEAFIDLTIDN
ncbi:MAG: NTP transferase domain-containing protein [Bacteroidaceae bacterium]|nr:NTP transferase domain-containing protein [Bacteroidaceae bacterium]